MLVVNFLRHQIVSGHLRGILDEWHTYTCKTTPITRGQVEKYEICCELNVV